MTSQKILIAYGTRMNATAEYANVIADNLRSKFGFIVDVINLKKEKKPDITPYQTIIIGSGIRIGRWTKEPLKLLKNKELENKKIAIFISSMESAQPDNYEKAIQDYLVKTIDKYPHVKPISTIAFGGWIKIMNKIVEDNRTVDKAAQWAQQIGNLI